MESLFEQLGGTYTRQGDYCYPMFAYRPKKNAPSRLRAAAASLSEGAPPGAVL